MSAYLNNMTNNNNVVACGPQAMADFKAGGCAAPAGAKKPKVDAPAAAAGAEDDDDDDDEDDEGEESD